MSSIERLRTIQRHISCRNCNDVGRYALSNISSSLHSVDSFQYTLPNTLLTKEQCQFYEDNGYILIPKLIPPDILDLCKQRFIDICNGTVSPGGMILMKEISLANTDVKGEYLYNKVQDILFDDIFYTCASYPQLLDVVECFTGPNIMAMHSMLINKPPDASKVASLHPTHQDLYYFPFRPADRIVASWIAMERVSVENGCLYVIPGTHKGVLHTHKYNQDSGKVNKFYYEIEDRGSESSKINIEMEKGDAVFFHPLLLHGSGPNLTKGFRKAISFHYAASECEYIKGSMDKSHEEELLRIAYKRGYEIDYSTIWSLKCRLVRGNQINL